MKNCGFKRHIYVLMTMKDPDISVLDQRTICKETSNPNHEWMYISKPAPEVFRLELRHPGIIRSKKSEYKNGSLRWVLKRLTTVYAIIRVLMSLQ